MYRHPIATLATLAVLLGSAAAQAEIYRWVDAQGRVHYTQTPPPGSQAQSVRGAPPPSAAPGVDGLKRYAESADKAASDAAKKSAEDKTKRDDKAGRCAHAQAQMQTMNTYPSGRMVEKDGDGNATRMTTERYDELRKQTQAEIDKHCTP